MEYLIGTERMGKPDCTKEPEARGRDEDPSRSIPNGPRSSAPHIEA